MIYCDYIVTINKILNIFSLGGEFVIPSRFHKKHKEEENETF